MILKSYHCVWHQLKFSTPIFKNVAFLFFNVNISFFPNNCKNYIERYKYSMNIWALRRKPGWLNILWPMLSFLLLSLSLTLFVYNTLIYRITCEQVCDQTGRQDRQGIQEGWAVRCVPKEMGWVFSQHKSTGRS